MKVGVNRFSHTGPLITRAALYSDKVDVVTINDPFIDLNYVLYMFQHDSTHGKFKDTVKAENRKLVINGKSISKFQERDPTNSKWGNAVAEYCGAYWCLHCLREVWGSLEGWSQEGRHLCPFCGCPMFVMGVNHDKYDNSMKIVSNTSCTTNCLNPLAKVIHVNFGFVEGLMTTVHAIIATQNTIPASTGTVGQVILELNGKLTGMAFHVPILNLSVVDLTCHLEKADKYDDIKKVVK